MKSSVLLVIVVTLAVLPLLLHRAAPGRSAGSAAAFEGADARASALVDRLRPGQEPWASPLFEPPGGEIEGLFFALQAALGAGVLSYYLGYARGRARAPLAARPSPGEPTAGR